MKEKAKKMVKETTDKATEMKDGIDVDSLKKKADDAKCQVTVEKLKALENKQKGIIGGAIVGLLLLVCFVFSGGNPSVSLADIKEPFPRNGTIEEQCTSVIMQEYNFQRLMIDKNESKEDLIATYDAVAKSVNLNEVSTMSDLEKRYWSSIRPASLRVEKAYDVVFDEKRAQYDRYLAGIPKCVEKNTK